MEDYSDRLLEEAEEARLLGGPYTDEYRDNVSQILVDQHGLAYEALISHDYRRVTQEADDLLKAANLPALNHRSVPFAKLCRRLLQAKIDYFSIEGDQWEGEYETPQTKHDHSSSPAEMVTATPKTAPPSPWKAPPAPSGPLFSSVVDQFIKKTIAPSNRRAIVSLQAELKKFLSMIKEDRPIQAITKADARAYTDHLLNVRKLSFTTAAKHIGTWAAIVKFALAQGYLPEGASNPFHGLAPSKKIIRKTKKHRRAFTEDELLTVFWSKDFMAQREDCPSKYWVCLMALFLGLGREEAAQVAIVDIHKSDGIDYIQTNDNEALQQSLKNQGSKRRVPVHSSLLTLGFLDYVQTIKQAGHVRLFLDLGKV